MLGEYIKTGLPVLISDGLLGLGNNAVAMVIGRLGAQFVSANAITTVVQQTGTVFVQVVSIPLGAMAGLVWGLAPFWVYCALKADQVIKAVWCVFRLRSGKWIKKIEGAKE